MTESSRPLVSLVFVVPLLIAYEAGLIAFGPRAMRNGADIWLRQGLEQLGFSQYFLLPVLTCGILLSWHHLKRERWQISWTAMLGMWCESLILGAALLVAAHWQSRLVSFDASRSILACETQAAESGRLVAFLGAGVYEELLFRLMLLPVTVAFFRWAGATQRFSLTVAVVAGGLLFAAAHYRLDLALYVFPLDLSAGESFDWMSFSFRALAGAFFSLLFWFRGFGVAAGTHALYDILVAEW
jgi:hypothetical protein